MLTNEIRRDFTFVHPEYLATDKYLIQGNQIHLDNKENYQNYKLVIIPGGKVISISKISGISYIQKNGQPYTKCKLNLKAVNSTFLIGK